MRTIEIRQYEMFVRVRDFGEARPDLFPPAAESTRALAAVTQSLAVVQTHWTALESGSGGTTAAKKAARGALEQRLVAVGRTARVMAKKTPGFDAPFRRPHRRQLDQVLLTAGRVAVTRAEPHAREFIAHGLPADFITELRGRVDRFEEALRGRASSKVRRAGASAAVSSALASGFAALRTLDVVVQNRCAGDETTLAMWRRARRVEYQRRAKRATDAPSQLPKVSVVALPD